MSKLISLRKSPLILVPKCIDGEVRTPAAKICGYISWELLRDGKVIKSSGGFYPNLITDIGMNQIAATTISNLVGYMNLGTGSTAPAFTDTGLVAEVATARQGGVQAVGPTYVAGTPDYAYRRNMYAFTELFANGNLTEVGLFWAGSGGSTMFIRQLLKDSGGTPVTVTKTSSDQLQITHEFRFYPPTADVAGSVTFSGQTYTLATRCGNVSSATTRLLGSYLSNHSHSGVNETDVLAVRSGGPSSGTGPNSSTITAYVAGSYYLETKDTWDIGSANFTTGIGSLASWDGNAYYYYSTLFQTTFAPKIAKTNTKRLILYYRVYWARY